MVDSFEKICENTIRHFYLPSIVDDFNRDNIELFNLFRAIEENKVHPNVLVEFLKNSFRKKVNLILSYSAIVESNLKTPIFEIILIRFLVFWNFLLPVAEVALKQRKINVNLYQVLLSELEENKARLLISTFKKYSGLIDNLNSYYFILLYNLVVYLNTVINTFVLKESFNSSMIRLAYEALENITGILIKHINMNMPANVQILLNKSLKIITLRNKTLKIIIDLIEGGLLDNKQYIIELEENYRLMMQLFQSERDQILLEIEQRLVLAMLYTLLFNNISYGIEYLNLKLLLDLFRKIDEKLIYDNINTVNVLYNFASEEIKNVADMREVLNNLVKIMKKSTIFRNLAEFIQKIIALIETEDIRKIRTHFPEIYNNIVHKPAKEVAEREIDEFIKVLINPHKLPI